MSLFICVVCGSSFSLPACSCGYEVPVTDNIWQFTDAPPIVTQGDGVHYIGYEEIGEHYSGVRKHIIEAWGDTIAAEIARLTERGVFLDLGCGDGAFAVPAAKRGVRVLAADISNNMMRILQQKAEHNGITLHPHTTLCRMNALQPAIASDCIQTATCNSVLHLISRPEKVIAEIHRVLIKGGAFVFKDDMPGSASNEMNDKSKAYTRLCNHMHKMYWDILRAKGYAPKRYNWIYDRKGICGGLFASREEIVIPWEHERVEKLKDGFLARFSGKGFSDQVDVPVLLHKDALEKTLELTRVEYGDDYGETEVYWVEPDIKLTLYRK